MAPPSRVFAAQKTIKHGELLKEKQGQRKYHYEVANADTTPSDNEILNKFANQYDSPIKNLPSERKCQVYVHHFSTIPSQTSNKKPWRFGSEVHQSMYKHEFSDYYGAKIQCIKKQFDNLSLNSKGMRASNSPNRISKPRNFHHAKLVDCERTNHGNRSQKMPQISSTPTARINKSFLFKPEHKAVADKLEETYWSKWKPNKTPASKTPCHKPKGLYTEKEKNNYQRAATNEKKERGDSNEAIAVCLSPVKLDVPCNSPVYPSPHQPDLCSLCASHELQTISNAEDSQSNSLQTEQDQVSVSKMEVANSEEIKNEDNISINNTSIAMVISKSDSECKIDILKHTDSFILTTKKQSVEKPRYQQPKCIKLFKSAGYISTAPTNYIKGGTYPLKSCLKKPNPAANQPSLLSCPGGSPVIAANNRKPGKASRYTTY